MVSKCIGFLFNNLIKSLGSVKKKELLNLLLFLTRGGGFTAGTDLVGDGLLVF